MQLWILYSTKTSRDFFAPKWAEEFSVDLGLTCPMPKNSRPDIPRQPPKIQTHNMNTQRIPSLKNPSATGTNKKFFDMLQANLGLNPNMTRAMAKSPAVLEGYMSLYLH